MRKIFFLLLLFGLVKANAQTIQIIDSLTNEPVINAHINLNDKVIAATDIYGKAQLNLNTGKYVLTISHIAYDSKQVTFNSALNKKAIYYLSANDILLGETVITGNKYEISAAKSTVTIDVIKPDLIRQNNSTSADQVLQRIPGVEIIDGQVNIRGGAGYSYGAGSRVMVLLDDIPILQADAGFPQWNDLPIELAGQIEVLKGASSSLYGSSAMNGIIHLRTDYAKSEPETGFFTYSKAFSKPDSQAWWSDKNRPFEFGFGLHHKQKLKNTDVVIGVFSKNLNSYNRATEENYKRLSGSIKNKPNERLSIGFNFNVNLANSSEFFFWKNLDSLFVPSSGTVSKVNARRFNIDPRITYFDKFKNRHRFLTRYHNVNNQTNAGRSNNSQLIYNEYQFYRSFDQINGHITAGLVNTYNSISAKLYGDTTFSTNNLAAYLQYDQQLNEKLKISFGARYENNTVNAPEYFNCRKDALTGLTICDTIPNGIKKESRPVFRFGGNYQLFKYTFLRASWGQGYRYPTVAEQFIKTAFGGTLISPNVNLNSESGWSSEFGARQAYSLGKLKGYFDLSLFWSQYQNMIEFNFIDLTTTGFQSVNVGATDIKGIEAVTAGKYKFNDFEFQYLIGYNFIDPKFQQFDTSAAAYTSPSTEGQLNAYNSSSRKNVLKYRFTNTYKYDFDFKFKKWSLGSSANYYSNMEAIDAVFEAFVVPGLSNYRTQNNSGNFILNLRASYKASNYLSLSFLANNVNNKLYSLRPGLMEAPRNFSVRLDIKL
ncbi:MAG: TonB-dependent receptor [Bacteroidia bacterium]